MKKRALSIAFGLITILSACGGDSSNNNSKSSASTAAGSGASGSGSKDGSLACGKDKCVLPDALKDQTLCCMDPFAGGCGIKAGASCRKLPEVDSRCPVPDSVSMSAMTMAVGVTAFGCCTTSNQCGIDFGMGCSPLSFLCSYISKDDAAALSPTTCDGDAVELPAGCGSQGRVTFPGAAGSGN